MRFGPFFWGQVLLTTILKFRIVLLSEKRLKPTAEQHKKYPMDHFTMWLIELFWNQLYSTLFHPVTNCIVRSLQPTWTNQVLFFVVCPSPSQKKSFQPFMCVSWHILTGAHFKNRQTGIQNCYELMCYGLSEGAQVIIKKEKSWKREQCTGISLFLWSSNYIYLQIVLGVLEYRMFFFHVTTSCSSFCVPLETKQRLWWVLLAISNLSNFNLQKETSRKTCEMLRLNLQNDDWCSFCWLS